MLAIKICDCIRCLNQRSTCHGNGVNTKDTITDAIDDDDSKNNTNAKTDDNMNKDHVTTATIVATALAKDNKQRHKNIMNQDYKNVNEDINPTHVLTTIALSKDDDETTIMSTFLTDGILFQCDDASSSKYFQTTGYLLRHLKKKHIFFIVFGI